MNRISQISLFVLLLLFTTSTAMFAQKFGHLNSGNLLTQLPEVKQADETLASYQKELINKGEQMAKTLETKIQAYVQDAQSGKLAPVEQQKQEATLEKERQAILSYEQEVIQKVEQKRQELLAPVVEKVNKAIQEVGKENGYTMIFDTSIMNAILFVEESDDILSLVKAKLGI